MKPLNFITGCVILMNQEHTSTMLMKQCMSTIEYLLKQIKPLRPELQLSDFYHTSEGQKNGELLLLQWAQV